MRVLAAFAHPDDETILIGGTLAMLADRGARVTFLSATRGEGGEVGEPPVCRREELGLVREAELRCAVRALGGADLILLDYVDPPVDEEGQGQAIPVEPERLAADLARAMQSTGAQVVITHGSNGEYGHPAHRQVHQAAVDAASRLRPAPVVYTVSAHFPDHPLPRLANADDPADFVLDIRPWLPAKLAAARCHRTQQALFTRWASKEAGRPVPLEEVLMRLESLHRAWPVSEGPPDDPLAAFLRQRCADALQTGEV